MNYLIFFYLFELLLALIGFGYERPPHQSSDLKGKSALYIKNNTSDSLNIKLENWYHIPFEVQELDTIISPSNIFKIDIVVQGNNYYDLFLDDSKFQIFTQPNAIDTIVLNRESAKLKVHFYGTLATINEFLISKANNFKSPDADWMPRVAATQSEKDFTKVIQINDSVTGIHQTFLAKSSSELPNWYVTFEHDRLNYFNAGSILNSYKYRKRMLNINDPVSPNFLQNIIGSLEINNSSLLGNNKYMTFLNSYISYLTNREIGEAKYKEKNLEIINRELDGYIRDFYLASALSVSLDRNRENFDPNLITQIHDQELNEFLKKLYNSTPTLPKGSKLPYFYLIDSGGDYLSSDDFKGKILLINFWATWCKPCYKEFPYENELVQKYQNVPVEIINICTESSKADWIKVIGEYQLNTINLYSSENWDRKLSRSYDINGLPHSVLVDWTGKVVLNKCPPASQHVDDMIDKLLIDHKSENK